jgi:RHS repeat-associated protein
VVGVTETNPLGHTTTRTFDPRGNVLTETDPLGAVTTMTYDAKNQLLTQVDAASRPVMCNIYSTVGLYLRESKDALGNATTFGYDTGIGSGETGELKSMRDALGHGVSYEINAKGWRIAEVDSLGNRTTYTHDSNGRVLTETKTRTSGAGMLQSLVTRTTYDAKGRVIRVEAPDGSATTMTYSAIDKLLTECDALNRCTSHEYDSRGNQTRSNYPDGSNESTTFDANGNTIAQTDRAGRVTKMVYDKANRVLETLAPDLTPSDADNPRTRAEYDAAGRTIASIDERGNRTEYRFDNASRRTQVIEAAIAGVNATSTTAYDATGRRISSTDALNRTTTFTYDAVGRQIQITFVDGASAQTIYDVVGRKIADIDPDGRRTNYAYDALGRLITVTLAANTPQATVTTYGYDEQGNRITQTDAMGRITRFEFDTMGREIKRTLPMGQVETKQYNAAGELINQTDFTGKTMRWQYDSIGRVTTIDYPNDADVTITYTATGQRATISDGHGTTSQTYDERERLTRRIDHANRAIEYGYDATGNLTHRTTANQSIVYAFDARNRLTQLVANVDGNPARTTSYTYDQVGNRASQTTGDGTKSDYTYDNRNRLRNLVQRSAAAAMLFSAAYSVDATGLRTGITEAGASGPARTVAYEYDALKRLTRETIDHQDNAKDRTSAWTYDAVGNRLTQTITSNNGPKSTTYQYDNNDRLSQENATPGGATAYSYDANGNTTAKFVEGVVIDYAYDDANRLKEERSGADKTTYAYNADGLRISQTAMPAAGSQVKTEYLVDPSYAYANVVERFSKVGSAQPTLSAVYTFGEGIVAQTTFDAGAATERFIQSDGFGSTRFLTNVAGAITDKLDYDAFGNELNREGVANVEHLYRGEQFDANLGWYYLRARYSSPERGAFITMDNWQGNPHTPASLHKYIYAEANPINGIDPSGKMTIAEQSAAAGVAGALIIASIASIAATRDWASRTSTSSGEGTSNQMPNLWDFLAIMYFRGRVISKSKAEAVAVVKPIPNHEHHTIPVYLCGAMLQDKSRITFAEHVAIHAAIAGLTVTKIGAEMLAEEVVFKRRRTTAVLDLAATKPGRAAIVAELDGLYTSGGWRSIGVRPIGENFDNEKLPYVSGVKTSLPLCMRKPPK